MFSSLLIYFLPNKLQEVQISASFTICQKGLLSKNVKKTIFYIQQQRLNILYIKIKYVFRVHAYFQIKLDYSHQSLINLIF